jgi:hypothetical protein
MGDAEIKRASAELNAEVTAIRWFQVEVMLVLKLARCECLQPPPIRDVSQVAGPVTDCSCFTTSIVRVIPHHMHAAFPHGLYSCFCSDTSASGFGG